jgi:hypothetical protein
MVEAFQQAQQIHRRFASIAIGSGKGRARPEETLLKVSTALPDLSDSLGSGAGSWPQFLSPLPRGFGTIRVAGGET